MQSNQRAIHGVLERLLSLIVDFLTASSSGSHAQAVVSGLWQLYINDTSVENVHKILIVIYVAVDSLDVKVLVLLFG